MGNHFSPEYLAKLGQKGGRATKRKRGSAWFRKLSKMRKHFGGGRPKKNKEDKAA